MYIYAMLNYGITLLSQAAEKDLWLKFDLPQVHTYIHTCKVKSIVKVFKPIHTITYIHIYAHAGLREGERGLCETANERRKAPERFERKRAVQPEHGRKEETGEGKGFSFALLFVRVST